jgi:glycosyltransferase involved in cell wall biosynthesis
MELTTAEPSPAPIAPRVSVITIFLNGEKYIGEAIESVIGQTYEYWELILVDDGSTDGATAIAKDYAERYPDRIRYIDHPGHENRGMSASRNAGMLAARGEFVGFLDADDIWLPRRIEIHVAALQRHPDVAMTMAPTLLWSSWSRDAPNRRSDGYIGDLITELGLPADRPFDPPIVAIGFLESHGGNVPGICSLLVRTEALRAVGGFEDSFRTLYEDQVFFFKICLRYKVVVIDEVLDYYRQHAGSTCSQLGGMAGDLKVRPVFLEWLQDHMVDNGYKSRRLWKAFRMEMFRYDHPDIYYWSGMPRRALDAWNLHTRRLVVWILTPKVYNWLRRKFRLSVVDIENVR